MSDNQSLLFEKSSLIPTIAEYHAKRIGWTRVCIGGFSMYLSVPIWILAHTLMAALCYMGFIAPILNLKKIRTEDYLVMMDRAKIKDLALPDKINCEFCSYANGLTTLINAQIDNFASIEEEKLILNWALAAPAMILAVIFAFVCEVFAIRLVYNYLVAGMLGLHTSRFGVIFFDLRKKNYGQNFNPLSRDILLFVKTVFVRFENLLEQIESSWCPIKHIERTKDLKFPEHHKNFFPAEQLYKMRDAIGTEGTVSNKKPLY